MIPCAFKSNQSFNSSRPRSPSVTKQKQQCGVRARDTRTVSHSPKLWPEVSKVLTQWLGLDLGKALRHRSLFLSAQAGLGQPGSHSGSHHLSFSLSHRTFMKLSQANRGLANYSYSHPGKAEVTKQRCLFRVDNLLPCHSIVFCLF